MTKTPDADMLVQSSTTPDNQITKTSSSASSLNIPSTEGIASAAGKLNVIAELAGNEKLAKKAAKVQKVASQAKQGIEIAQNVLHRVQTWGQKNKVPEGVPNAAAASSGLSQLLGLSPSGLQFTLQSAGLPPTTFEVIRFNLYEHYNELFALDVEVASADAAIAFNAVLDNQATLTLWRDGKQLRQVKGIVAHFEQGDSGFHQTFYRLHIVPDMWRLGLRANSRIFQQKDIQSILTTLLSDNKVMDYRFVLRDSHPAREFCVQYRETDLDFFNRLTGVTYEGEQPQAAKQDAGGGATTLHCVFTCIPRHQTWRPLQRTKPLVEGPQPAIVTGPKGEEIYTDNFGRVRLQFLWDREGKYDDHSSCWVRVTQPWAGKGWGMVAIPRVGHEVMVDFLEGDPDQPIVTGRTYHANMPLPAKLPQHKTQMHLMSQTYKGGGYNGMMMEDEQGKQRLDFQAQRDMNTLVINDRATNVGGNHKETVKGEQKISVGQARYKEVVGEETQTIDEAQIITVGKDYQLTTNSGALSMTSKADNVIFETAGARLTLFKNGNIQLEGKSVCINGAPIELNPGGAAASSAETDSAPASDAGGDGGAGGGGAEGGGLSTSTPPPGAIAAGTEEFGKRGENLMKSTTPLKNGEFKYYDNGWKGNQHVKTQNVFNKNAIKVAKSAPIVGKLLDASEVAEGIYQDAKEYKKNSEQGKFVAKNTTVQTVGVAGGLGGAWIGIKLGGAAGAPGGFLGAIGGAVVGGVIGAWGGEAALEAIAEKTIEFFE